MMKPLPGDDLDNDEFLSAPGLFRYGPAVLTLLSIGLAVSVVLLCAWRIDENRHAEYEKVFRLSETAAMATVERAELTAGRLVQAAHAIARQPAGAKGVLTGLDLKDLGLDGLARGVLVLSGSGAVVAVAPLGDKGLGREALEAHAEALAGTPVPRFAPVVLPARPALSGASELTSTSPAQVLPYVVPLEPARERAAAVVFLVDARIVSRPATGFFGEGGGWLEIADAEGQVVFASPAVKPQAVMRSPQEAMRHTLGVGGERYLASTAASSGALRFSVGVLEADALAEFRSRVAASWSIVAGALGAFLTVCFLTGCAILRFSRTERYLRRLATADSLTGLPNRRSFRCLLRKAIRRAESAGDGGGLVLMFIDIDNFKLVNDSAGHSLGDALLRHVAGVLTDTVKSRGTVCRLAGDEFTVLVEGEPCAAAALALAESLLDRLRVPSQVGDAELITRASIGIAMYPRDGRTGDELMRCADTAMYQAKSQGKGRCLAYDASMSADALAGARLMRELSHAIANDELFLEYQPKFALDSGALTGHEALVRWQHPKRGRLAPSHFIALAEETGLISDLGDWVLREAISQVRRWHEQGHGWHRVAVNVSPCQFRSRSFASHVGAVLAQYAVPGEMLQIEITEGSLTTDIEQARKALHELRLLGVLVAVDDFGTGYSSLSSLLQFELDLLKVDRSFVTALDTEGGEKVCRAVVELGRALGLRIIAEGVETREQAVTLCRMGCDQGQGYYLARPCAPDTAVAAGPVDSFALPGSTPSPKRSAPEPETGRTADLCAA